MPPKKRTMNKAIPLKRKTNRYRFRTSECFEEHECSAKCGGNPEKGIFGNCINNKCVCDQPTNTKPEIEIG